MPKLAGTLAGHSDGVECVAFVGAGMAASGGLDGNAVVWDLASMAPRGPPCSHPAGVLRVLPTPDAVLLWTACVDGAVRGTVGRAPMFSGGWLGPI